MKNSSPELIFVPLLQLRHSLHLEIIHKSYLILIFKCDAASLKDEPQCEKGPTVLPEEKKKIKGELSKMRFQKSS